MTDSELLKALLEGFYIDSNGDVQWTFIENTSIAIAICPEAQNEMAKRIRQAEGTTP